MRTEGMHGVERKKIACEIQDRARIEGESHSSANWPIGFYFHECVDFYNACNRSSGTRLALDKRSRARARRYFSQIFRLDGLPRYALVMLISICDERASLIIERTGESESLCHYATDPDQLSPRIIPPLQLSPALKTRC